MLSLALAVLTQSPLSISQVLAPFWVRPNGVSVDASSSVSDTTQFLVLVSSQHNSSDTFTLVNDNTDGLESFETAAAATFDVAFELQLTGSSSAASEGRCNTSFVALAATESEFQKSELSFKDESSNNGTVSEDVVKEFLLDVSTESN